MRAGRLNKLLLLWEKNNLISQEQNKAISEFMKERQKENLFRMLKWFSIIGAFWLVFGVIMLIINILDLLDALNNILYFFADILRSGAEFFCNYIWLPIKELLQQCFGRNYTNFLWGIFGFGLFALFFRLSEKLKADKNIDALNLSDEQKNILKTNFVFDTLSVICLSAGFINFNFLLCNVDEKCFPIWIFVGILSFITIAYMNGKNIYLIFGIYFISMMAGMFTGCGYASYFLAVTEPIIQLLTGLLLIAAGYVSELKFENKDNYTQEKFISTYYWTGLLLSFLALWVATFWGFDIDKESTAELWLANILLIIASVGAMFWGVKQEKRIFFNYGLVFLLIETYTIIFSQIFTTLPVGIASLILGGALIGTAKVMKKLYFKKQMGGAKNE